MWGNEPKNQNEAWGLPGVSRMTAVEAALYFDVPNVVMVSHRGLPAPPLDQDALAMRPLRRVVWSIVNSGGGTSADYREHVFDVAARFPNFTGVLMDDFFHGSEEQAQEASGSLTPDELRAVRDKLSLPDGRQLELWAVLYTHQFGLPVQDHLALCDKVNFWTSRAGDLADLETNFARLEELHPQIPKIQGLYMWDFGARASVPVELMRLQCETGLKWLKAGRIEGMVFIASCVADFGLEVVEWTREWIAGVGDERLSCG